MQAITVDNKMDILGGADWVTQAAVKRMWIYDQVLQVSGTYLSAFQLTKGSSSPVQAPKHVYTPMQCMPWN